MINPVVIRKTLQPLFKGINCLVHRHRSPEPCHIHLVDSLTGHSSYSSVSSCLGSTFTFISPPDSKGPAVVSGKPVTVSTRESISRDAFASHCTAFSSQPRKSLTPSI